MKLEPGINQSEAETETYSTGTEGQRTSGCESCIVVHEFLDHALPYVKNPGRIWSGNEGVENHNKALKIKGSAPRDGKGHDDKIYFKRPN